jgi:hypothetical protein
MSDPVTNVEIEDVLASIRRLVLESAAPQAPANAAVRQEPATDRLVLTPALRVVEPRGPIAGTVAPVAGDIIPGGTAEKEPADDLLRDVAEDAAGRAGLIEVAVDSDAGEWEPDGSENVPVMDWSRTTPEDAPVFRSRHMAPLRLEHAVPAPEEPPFRHTPVAPREDVAAADPDGLAAFAAAEAEAAREEADLRAFLDRATVDEEMLRRIVTQVLQQELQGALGERITRNVRKLVRREINRALMDEQDF